MTKINITELTKIYDGDVLAVDNVDLTVEDGEFVTLVGPSGSGKSTILRMLAGLVTPTSGEILFDDEDVTQTPPQERDIAMVFQDYALYPNMDVRGNMEFGLKMHGLPAEKRDAAVQDAAEMLQIEELLDRNIKQLSGGQQQRVALGRSLVRDPDVFLLDEPLANLDAKLRAEMRTTLIELQRDLDITTVYVTHNQIEAMTMSDQVAVVNYGEIQQFDGPQELFRSPSNRFVADFIGNPTMNFHNCQIDPKSGQLSTSSFDIDLSSNTEIMNKVERLDRGEYIMGIRPQHLNLNPTTKRNGTTIQTEVAIVEPAGEQQILHLETGEERITTVADENLRINEGDEATLEVDLQSLHLFDRESEKAVL
jgi:multiple sugar transport system ATP-binding protein